MREVLRNYLLFATMLLSLGFGFSKNAYAQMEEVYVYGSRNAVVRCDGIDAISCEMDLYEAMMADQYNDYDPYDYFDQDNDDPVALASAVTIASALPRGFSLMSFSKKLAVLKDLASRGILQKLGHNALRSIMLEVQYRNSLELANPTNLRNVMNVLRGAGGFATVGSMLTTLGISASSIGGWTIGSYLYEQYKAEPGFTDFWDRVYGFLNDPYTDLNNPGFDEPYYDRKFGSGYP